MPTKSQAALRTPNKTAAVAPYRWLAEYYDTVFAGMRSPMEPAQAAILDPKILPEARTVCDLACGTGDTAIEFARRGLDVYAVDLSPGMCRRTREKAKTAGCKVRVILRTCGTSGCRDPST
jgi:ubiquinone/menaquinone biosynthesis C-methylase UbiE